MKFNTIKEMKDKLAAVTNVKDLHEDMTFLSQGQSITVRYIGDGSVAYRGVDGQIGGNMSAVYVGDDTSSSARVEYTGSGRNITVTYVSVNKQV